MDKNLIKSLYKAKEKVTEIYFLLDEELGTEMCTLGNLFHKDDELDAISDKALDSIREYLGHLSYLIDEAERDAKRKDE